MEQISNNIFFTLMRILTSFFVSVRAQIIDLIKAQFYVAMETLALMTKKIKGLQARTKITGQCCFSPPP